MVVYFVVNILIKWQLIISQAEGYDAIRFATLFTLIIIHNNPARPVPGLVLLDVFCSEIAVQNIFNSFKGLVLTLRLHNIYST